MSDLAVLVGRNARLTLRTTDALVMALVLPIVLVAVFVWLFGGALDADGRYVDVVVPGVLVLCAGFGAGGTAAAVAHDLASGTTDRLRVADVGGTVLLAGHVTVAVLRNLASSALVVGAALLLGYRPSAGPAGWLVAVGVLVAYLTAMTAVATCLGLVAGSVEAANGSTFALMFFGYPSSAVVPVDTLPSWLQGFAAHQPVTPVVDTLRGLLLGTSPADLVGTATTALAWCAAVTVACGVLAGVLWRRRAL